MNTEKLYVIAEKDKKKIHVGRCHYDNASGLLLSK